MIVFIVIWFAQVAVKDVANEVIEKRGLKPVYEKLQGVQEEIFEEGKNYCEGKKRIQECEDRHKEIFGNYQKDMLIISTVGYLLENFAHCSGMIDEAALKYFFTDW